MKNPFKKDEAQTDANIGSSVAKKAQHQKTLASFLWVILAAASILVLSLIVVYSILLFNSNNNAVESQAKGISFMTASKIGDYLSKYNNIATIIATNQQVIDSLEKRGSNQIHINATAKLVKSTLAPKALGLNILPRKWNKIDSKRTLPISYASLDLIKQAVENKKNTKIEIHGIQNRKKHVVIVAPIRSRQGKIIGVVHIGWPTVELEKTFRHLNFPGKIALAQLIGREGVIIAKNKAGLSIKDRDNAKTDIPNSIWKILSKAEKEGIGLMGLVIALLGLLGLGAIAGVILYQLKQLKYALRSDQAKIVEMLDRTANGTTLVSPSATVFENQDTMELVSRNLNNLQTTLSTNTKGNKSGMTSPAAIQDPMGSETTDIPASIFRAYDIRGIVDQTLTPDIVYEIGRAVGSAAYEQGQQTVLIGRDGRHSGPDLSAALASGLMASGRDVINLGMVPTPVVYFCTHFLGADSGVMITGSHNPPNYNGLKIVIGGEALSGDTIMALKRRIDDDDLLEGQGQMTEQDVTQDYLDRIIEDTVLGQSMKVVVDAGNGVAGPLAVQLLEEMGCEVIQLYCDIDGDFPNHHPDPGQLVNLEDLQAMVTNEQADIGIAFDGDGDRIGVVDSNGKVILPDRLLMLLATDVLTRQPGADIIYDIKSTKNLANHILMAGGRPVMWKTGHSLIKAKMRETGAVLAGEMSGHIFFKERWYGFDDAIYTCARLLEIISLDGRNTAEIFAELPDSVNTPELTLSVEEGTQYKLIENLKENADFPDAQVIDIDGLRIEFSTAWGLVRASNTTPSLVFRFEADDSESLKEVQNIFRDFLLRVDPDLNLPF